MVERPKDTKRGIVWDPEVDCKPGRPENQHIVPTAIGEQTDETPPVQEPVTTRRVRKKGPPGRKTIVEKGDREHGAQR